MEGELIGEVNVRSEGGIKNLGSWKGMSLPANLSCTRYMATANSSEFRYLSLRIAARSLESSSCLGTTETYKGGRGVPDMCELFHRQMIFPQEPQHTILRDKACPFSV